MIYIYITMLLSFFLNAKENTSQIKKIIYIPKIEIEGDIIEENKYIMKKKHSNKMTIYPNLLSFSKIDLDILASGGGVITPRISGYLSKYIDICIDLFCLKGPTGTVNLNKMPIDAVESIEYDFGPSSNLTGSKMGGVLNLTTINFNKKPYFSYNMDIGSLSKGWSISGQDNLDKNFKYHISVGSKDGRFNQSADGDKDLDAWHKTFISLGFYKKIKNTEFKLKFFYTKGLSEYDRIGEDPTRYYSDLILSSDIKHIINDYWNIGMNLGFYNSDNLEDLKIDEKLTYNIKKIKIYSDYNIKDYSFLLALDLEKINFKNYPNADLDDIYNFSPVFNLKSKFGEFSYKLYLNANHISYSLMYLYDYDFTDNLKTYISLSRDFQPPSINELYYPNYGKPDIKPEHGISFEAGLDYENDFFKGDLGFYYRNLYNLIEYSAKTHSPVNIGKSLILGAKYENIIKINPFEIYFGLHMINAVDKIKNTKLPHIIPITLRTRMDYAISNNHKIWLGLEAKSEKNEGWGKTSGYYKIDLGTVHNFYKQFYVKININNLLDKIYQKIYGYNSPRRNINLSVYYKF